MNKQNYYNYIINWLWGKKRVLASRRPEKLQGICHALKNDAQGNYLAIFPADENNLYLNEEQLRFNNNTYNDIFDYAPNNINNFLNKKRIKVFFNLLSKLIAIQIKIQLIVSYLLIKKS